MGPVVAKHNIGRNERCSCGSGKKFKHCCGDSTRSQAGGTAAGIAGEGLGTRARGPDNGALLGRAPLRSLATEWCEQGNRLLQSGAFEEAIGCYRRALDLEPLLEAAHGNLGVALQSKGLWEEALDCYWAAIKHGRGSPSAVAAHANYVACLMAQQSELFKLQRARTDRPEQVFAAHVRLARKLESYTRASWRAHSNRPDPERRLRVGYVSPDFRRHSVAYFIEPILAHHDRDRVSVFCYHTCPLDDAVTARIARTADHWLACAQLSPESLAERIRQDEIDILVDLAGHTAGNRFLTFALKPAPIQMAYLGYPVTTGLTAMDYRLTDALADPAGLADAFFVEAPLHLESATVYRPPFGTAGLLGDRELPVTPAPLLTNGFPTFGCFNDFSKLGAPVLDVWARLLKAVPGSRLVLKSSELGEANRRMELHHGLAGRGIDPGRLVLLGRDEDAYAHLARYAQIDVALDTFPYNGVTTSFESIWMGVPVVTLAGSTPPSRMGVSIATNLGHPEWIAATPDDYVRLAAKLAADAGELNRLRLGLRQELEASPLLDARSFTSKLETLYRQTWRTWCAQQS